MVSMASVNATDRRGGLHERRKAAGLSQQRLAELAGCSLTFVRVLEAGYAPVTSNVLPRIEAVLDGPTQSSAPGGNGGAATSSGVGAPSGARSG
jgi:transcriptional regulator with XRE-family HTH domain